jgi:hypothetical protein
VTAGSNRIEIQRVGYIGFESQVVVAPGETTNLNVSLSTNDGL